MRTATLVKSLDGWKGDARLYKLDPPAKCEDGETAEYVIVSAVDAMFSGPETYIFAADSDGQVMSYAELDGSVRGTLDHLVALEDAGYEVVS